MKTIKTLLTVATIALTMCSCGKTYTYRTIKTGMQFDDYQQRDSVKVGDTVWFYNWEMHKPEDRVIGAVLIKIK